MVELSNVRRFLAAVNTARDVKEKKDTKRKGIDAHLSKMSAKSSRSLKKEISELKGEIEKALDDDQYLMKRQKEEDELIKNLRSEVELMHQSMSVFQNSFKEMVEERDKRINALSMSINLLHERARAGSLKKVKDLEKKIQKRVEDDEEKINLILKQLETLEDMHKQMTKMKSHSPVDLDRVRIKIETLKDKIKEINKGS